MAKVKVYTKESCPWCRKAKEWLKEHNIKYEEFDVLKDEKARKYITEKTGETGVPQIEINGKVIIGFDEEALEKELL